MGIALRTNRLVNDCGSIDHESFASRRFQRLGPGPYAGRRGRRANDCPSIDPESFAGQPYGRRPGCAAEPAIPLNRRIDIDRIIEA